jgi:ABC transport system ATP-binding/permease protein
MAPRNLISLEDVTLTFGGKPLFENIKLTINDGDKICLVGKNGAGKTTLMRILMNDLELDAGKRSAVPGLSIGYLAQKVFYNHTHTVREFVLEGLGTGDDAIEKQHLAERMMEPLELEADALMLTLSGGQLRRASLARALVVAPDVLLLDEPTNHLDIAAIEWLEKYLSSYRGALLCVSHDRAFLAAVSRKVLWIDRGIVRTFNRSYAEFDEWAEQIIEHEARELQNMQKKLIQEEDWTQGGVSGRRKRNQRRLGELYRLREKLRSEKASYNNMKRKVELDPLSPSTASKLVAEFKQVSKSFPRSDGTTLPILSDFSMRVMRGDRIGILGRNGSGKSTFLKLLTGELQQDEGHIRRGKTIRVSYFDQSRSMLDPSKTLWDTLCPDGGDQVKIGSGADEKSTHVCGYLKQFLFDPKNARDKVSTLSGGQQNRLLLAKMLANPGNVLILDEPTNDLDMDTLDMLQEILADYPGTLLLVSHDRDFLDRTVTEILAFEGDAVVESHIGGYTDYVRFKQQQAQPAKPTTIAPAAIIETAPKKTSGRMSFKHVHELKTLPDRIEALTNEITDLKTLLGDNTFYMRDPEQFDKASRRFATAQAELEFAEHRWLELEEQRQKNGG